MMTLLAPPKQFEARFVKLAADWQRDTSYLSSTTAIANHPAYQRINGLGSQVIHLILTELQHQPGHRFWAFTARTSENPVDSVDQGRVPAVTAVWLKRGADNGWIA